jgi:hypothetical protein
MELTLAMNRCIFRECRRYRYVLDHAYGDMFSQSLDYIAFVGLNPSVANEDHLDPTLRRIKSFTTSFGYHRFIMLNLFALVSTDPKNMLLHPDPIGPENDAHILRVCSDAKLVVACWGSLGRHMKRDEKVLDVLSGIKLSCLGVTGNSSPMHPLYLASESTLRSYPLNHDQNEKEINDE